MSSVNCQRCGATIVSGGRFCRRCGQAVAVMDVPSVTEAPTQVFENTSQYVPPPAPYNNAPPTNPAQSYAGTQALANTNKPKSSRWKWFLIFASLLVLILGAGISIGIIMKERNERRMRQRPLFPPPPPQAPVIIPPKGPVAEHPPEIDMETGEAISGEFIYPGAKVTMNILKGEEGRVVQIHTDDPFDKVVDWYTNKIKPAKVIRLPSTSAVLHSSKLTAIINADGNSGTNVILREGTGEEH